MRDGCCESSGISLYYKIFGQGETVIVLHGGPGYDHLHMLPLKELSDAFRLVFYDQRATGHSTGEADAASITMENFIADLDVLRSHLNIETFHILGHSWGSVLALHYALQHPHRLKTMTLLAAYGSAAIFPQFMENMQKRTSPEDAERLKSIQESTDYQKHDPHAFSHFTRVAVRPLFHQPSQAESMDFSMGPNTPRNQEKVAGLMMQQLMNFDIHHGLNIIQCPSLLLHGEADALPLEGPEKLKNHLNRCRLKIIKEAGHFIFVEKTEETLNAIREFLMDTPVSG